MDTGHQRPSHGRPACLHCLWEAATRLLFDISEKLIHSITLGAEETSEVNIMLPQRDMNRLLHFSNPAVGGQLSDVR